MILTVVIFIVTLLILVLVHEFGHFIVAKKFKVKVLEFGFGLPPRIFGRKVGETMISLNALPVGGFVRLFGEDEVDNKILKHKDSFASKPVGQRIAIVVAGVIMNFILAAVLFWILIAAKGFKEEMFLISPHLFFGVNQINKTITIVGNVTEKSPAALVGIKPMDEISKFNNIPVNSAEQLTDLTKENAGEAVTLTVIDQEDQTRQIIVVPRTSPPKGEGPLGIQLGTVTAADIIYSTPLQKIFAGIIKSYNYTEYSINMFGFFISKSISMKNLTPVSEVVSSPVGIGIYANSILQTPSPFLPYLEFMGVLSLSLAVINILPIPALDGGRLVFLVIELVRKKRIDPELERKINSFGMIFLLLLFSLVIIKDIRGLFSF